MNDHKLKLRIQASRVKEKFEMHDNTHELKVLMLYASTGFYHMQRYRVGDFFGPVDLRIHLAFKYNALAEGAEEVEELIKKMK